MSNVGCRIFTEVPRPPKELVERFRGLPVANIGDNMNRIYCVDSAIRSMNGKPMLGVAYTLHLPSGDNLLLHQAIEMAQPGDVLLISAGGPERAYCGELMMMDCRNHGFAGCAIDGYLRDIDEISHMDFPVFARGITPQGPYKFGPGEINVPIAFGGLLSAIAQGKVAAASVNILAKKPDDWSKGMILCITVEFYAILSLLASMMMLLFI